MFSVHIDFPLKFSIKYKMLIESSVMLLTSTTSEYGKSLSLPTVFFNLYIKNLFKDNKKSQ
jgi:hypothetical protein